MMLASMTRSITTAIPTLLLLASAAVAQEDTPSASVTSFASSASASGEQIFTIQTSTPPLDPWACYQDCLMPPCPPSPCSTTSSGTGMLSATPVPLPRPVSESVVSVITDSSLSSVTGFMSIPQGETPISSGAMDTSAASSTRPASSSSHTSSAGSRTTSGLPQATSNAAALNAKANHIPLVAAVAGALALL